MHNRLETLVATAFSKSTNKHKFKEKGRSLLGAALMLQVLCPSALLAQSVPITDASAPPAPNIPQSNTPQVPSPQLPTQLSTALSSQPVFIDIVQSNGTLSFSGDFVNNTNLTLFTSNPAFMTATITATGSIINAQGATISTVLPAGGYAGALNMPLNLVLNAANSIFNAGTISSSSNLSMSASQIVNALPATAPVSTPVPVMTAINSINAITPMLANQGMISSALGNINIIAATSSSNLAINALNGVFQAPNGIVQVGDSSILNHLNIDILGGDFISKALSIDAGTGNTNVSVNSILGTLNLNSATASILCNTGTLALGDFHVSGAQNFSPLSLFSLAAESADEPTYIFSNGDIKFVANTEADFLVLTTGGNILNDGASAIRTHNTLQLYAGKNIDLSGMQSVADDSANGSVYLVADGGINIPDMTISSGAGGITIFAKGDIYGGKGVTLNTSLTPGQPGRIFVASQNGAVDLGTAGLVTTGEMAPDTVVVGPGALFAVSLASFNGLTFGKIQAPGGEVVLGSGIESAGNRFSGWVSKTLTGNNHLGTGGISGGDVSIRTDGSLQDARLIVSATNGSMNLNSVSGNGGLVSLLATESMTVTEGINNVSIGATGGTVLVAFGEHVGIPTGINNDSLNGSGGEIVVGASAPQGFTLGQDLKVSNNAATDGGRITAENVGGSLFVAPAGIQGATNGNGTSLFLSTLSVDETPANITFSGELHIADAKGNGNGGFVSMSSGGDLFISNALITANGSGSGKGGTVGLSAENTVHASNTSLVANGGSSNGSGGAAGVSARALEAVDLNVQANGQGSGSGGFLNFSLRDSVNLTGSNVKASARGGNGGSLFVYSDGPITIDNAWFNISPFGGIAGAGNGGSIEALSWSSSITTIGNLNVDGIDSGNGGTIYLTAQGSGSNLTLGGSGDTKFFARGGQDGGNGGRIDIRTGGDLLVLDTAVLNAQVRGDEGSGGTIVLSAGYGSASGGSLYLNKNLSVNAMGSGDGGTVGLNARTGEGGGGPIETLALSSVGPGDGKGLFVNANLSANGAGAGRGGIIGMTLIGNGTAKVNGNLSANAGTDGNGGAVTLSTLGQDAPVELTGKIAANGGTETGAGGFVELSAAGSMQINTSDISADARGDGDGGNVILEVKTGGGGVIGSFSALSEVQTATLEMNGQVSAIGRNNGAGGQIRIQSNGNSPFYVESTALINSKSQTDDGRILIQNPEQELSVTAAGRINGKLELEAKHIEVSASSDNQNLTLGSSTATAGDLLVEVTGAKSQIRVLSGASLVANGADGVKAGHISIRAASNVTVEQGARIAVNANAEQQSGGSIDIGAGTTESGVFRNFGEISANGIGDSAGGQILISQSSSEFMHLGGTITADAPGEGNSGDVRITLNNTADADLNVKVDGVVSASSASGTPASIYIDHTGNNTIKLTGHGKLVSVVNLTGKNINVEAAPEQIAGAVRLRAGDITSANGSISLVARGDSSIVLNAERTIKAADKITIEARTIRANTGSTISAGAAVYLGTGKLINSGLIESGAVNGIVVEGDLSVAASELVVSGEGTFRITSKGTPNLVTFANITQNNGIVFSGKQTFANTSVEIGGAVLGSQNRIDNVRFSGGNQFVVQDGALIVRGISTNVQSGATVETKANTGDITIIARELSNSGQISSANNIDLVGSSFNNSPIVHRLLLSGTGFHAAKSIFIGGSPNPNGLDNPLPLVELSIDGSVQLSAGSTVLIAAEEILVPAQSSLSVPGEGSLKFVGIRNMVNDGHIEAPDRSVSFSNIGTDDAHSQMRIVVSGAGGITGASLSFQSGAWIDVSQDKLSGTLLGILASDRRGASIASTHGDLVIAGITEIGKGSFELRAKDGNVTVGSGALIRAEKGISLLSDKGGGTVSIGASSNLVASTNGIIAIGTSVIPSSSAVPENLTLAGKAVAGKNVFFEGNIVAAPSTINMIKTGLVSINASSLSSVNLGQGVNIRIDPGPFSPVGFGRSQNRIEVSEPLDSPFSITSFNSCSNGNFQNGEWVIAAKRDGRVNLSGCSIEVARGTCLLIQTNEDKLAVYNLFDNAARSVQVTIKGRKIDLPIGQEFRTQITPFESVAERNSLPLVADRYYLAEYSLSHLVGTSELLRKYLTEIRSMRNKVLKSAAIANLIWSSHGRYDTPHND